MPELILETGVANGVSSYFIIKALQRNGKGKLVSVDISDNVGGILNDDERKWWNLIVINRPTKKAFEDIVDKLGGGIDIFLHDSDHSYKWQSIEYNSVFPKMKNDGLIISDDIDSSNAFIDFISYKKLESYALIDKRKVVGIVMV